jgi:hypothetical protein
MARAVVNGMFTITLDDSRVMEQLDSIELMISESSLENFLSNVAVPYLQDRVDQRFANEGDDVVGQWKDLAGATISIRQSLGYPGDHPINQRTGEMLDYLDTNQGEISAAPGDIRVTYPGGSMSVEVQQKLMTAQFGRDTPKTPKRPVLGINQIDAVDLTDDLSRYLIGGLIGI